MGLSQYELEVGKAVLDRLQSDKYREKNYLFLTPFDLNQVPGYLDVVRKPMDLQTAGEKLAAGKYDSATEFWSDVSSVFENAIAYHTDKPSKRIAKMAKDMLKVMSKERKIVEKKKARAAAGGDAGAIDETDMATESTSVDVDAGPPPVKLKTKIKLKTKSSSSPVPSEEASTSAAMGEEASVVPKKPKSLKIKLNTGSKSQGKQLPPAAAQEIDDENEISPTINPPENPPEKEKKKKNKLSVRLKLPTAEGLPVDEQPPPLKKQKKSLEISIEDPIANTPKSALSETPKSVASETPSSGASSEKKKKSKKKAAAIASAMARAAAEAADDNAQDLSLGSKEVVEKVTKPEGKDPMKIPAASKPVKGKTKLKLKLSLGKNKDESGKIKDEASKSKDEAGRNKDEAGKNKDEAGKNNEQAAVSTIPKQTVSEGSTKPSGSGSKLRLSLKTSDKAKSKSVSDALQPAPPQDAPVVPPDSIAKKKKKKVDANRVVDAGEKKADKKILEPKKEDDSGEKKVDKKILDKKKDNNSGPKIQLKFGGPSRGKELPKAVQQQEAAAAAAAAGKDETATVSSTAAKIKAGKDAKVALATAKDPASNPPPKPAKAEKPQKAEEGRKAAEASLPENPKEKISVTKKSGKKKLKKLPTPKAAVNAAAAAKANAPGAIISPPVPGGTSPKSLSATAPILPGKVKPTTSPSVMSIQQRRQATKVLNGLRRRHQKQISWFQNPVADRNIIQDYRAKIKNPMDISTMTSKLESNAYSCISDFVLDLRRIFANCLRYNSSTKDALRPVAVEVMQASEDLMTVFLAKPELPNPQPYPQLLWCWKLCIEVLDALINLVNPGDGQPTVLYFLHPVSFYCGGEFPKEYLQKIEKPMDFGTVTSNLLEGIYQSVDDFASDCRLVISNCNTYYNEREGGKVYVEQANRLNERLTQQLDQLARYAKSTKGATDRTKASSIATTLALPQPPQELLQSLVNDLRALKYTDKATKITEAAMGPFEKPVSLAVFPDYARHIQEPMDLQTIEKKIKAGEYPTPEDFEYDVNLMFRNCEVYNSQRSGDHLVSMAKFGARKFRLLFFAKMRAFEDPSSMPPSRADRAQESATKNSSDKSPSTSPPAKKVKVESSGVTKAKTSARISITAANSSATVTAAAAASAPAPSASTTKERSKSPKPTAPTTTSTQKKNTAQPILKPDQPVPLHIAIARVKEAFPLRRTIKILESWEADCARYFKDLLRHPWLSAARPKFIFHVPVPDLFPELREAYAAKINTPMDLTTVECKLLDGKSYHSPEDFVQDVALVFANAVRFNKDGRDIGDPLSCAYYDASVHLLRYSRWLSLELLSAHVVNSDYTDENGAEDLPPLSWKLTTGNRQRAREEMESIVLREPLEKSIEGDRFTWQESECEKLLKALKHTTDLKCMQFFLQDDFPANYTAFISKPMYWEKVQRTLKKRQYDKFGDIIDDLRLIFSNALKYNGRLKDTHPIHKVAYEGAEYMSAKLEVAINKLMLSVSDRLERERIDHANAEREIEAAERAEEAAIRAAWKKEPDKAGSTQGTVSNRSENSQRVRAVRRVAQQRETTDFEIPFFDDEDDGKHESSYFEVVKFQKAMFEKQRRELTEMRQSATSVGAAVYNRLLQLELASQWVKSETDKVVALKNKSKSSSMPEAGDGQRSLHVSQETNSSSVLSELERKDRGPLQIKLAGLKPKTNRSNRKRPLLMLD